MATGRCVNIMGCSKARNREEQEADLANFVCSECGKPLVEVRGANGPTPPSGGGGGKTKGSTETRKHKIWIIIAAVLVVILGGGGGAYYYFNGNEPKNEPKNEPTIEKIELNRSHISGSVGNEETLTVTNTPSDMKVTYLWKSTNENVITVQEGVIKMVGEGEANVIVSAQEKQGVADTCSVSVKFQSGPNIDNPKPGNEIDLGYATYKGDLQNGKPHGNGTMTFKKRTVVPGAKDNIEAQSGEYAHGAWRNGEVNLVTLHQKNGNTVTIMHK